MAKQTYRLQPNSGCLISGPVFLKLVKGTKS